MTGKLTDFEKWVIEEKGTEKPFSGEYCNFDAPGYYHCRKCDAPLYRSEHKFQSQCGWPSFDDEIRGAVKRLPDPDGRRTEIVCQACGGHLGHVFEGEKLTEKNIRHCVNSVSLKFKSTVPAAEGRALFASGCFWGTQYHFARVPGVYRTRVGYAGGETQNPTYREVCSGATGHLEVVEVLYDPTKCTFRDLAKLFFETHDFTQKDGQGPDIGSQYLSAIFCLNTDQKQEAEKLVTELRNRGYDVATQLRETAHFWPGEEYHQDYYARRGESPYCHIYRKIF